LMKIKTKKPNTSRVRLAFGFSKFMVSSAGEISC